MKKSNIILGIAAIGFLIASVISCKGKKQGDAAGTDQPAVSTDAKPAEEPKAATGSPKTYELSLAPDTVLLGKEKEAFVKLLGGEAVELQDADGKVTGTHIKFKLRVTNKSTLEDKKFFNISSRDARLELDNGTSITAEAGDSLNPEAESSIDGNWEFSLPAGTKPTKLNLFYDGTRVGVAVTMK